MKRREVRAGSEARGNSCRKGGWMTVKTTERTDLWTREDELCLYENYKNMPVQQLAEKLNRSERAVRVKASDLKLSKRRYVTQEHERIVELAKTAKSYQEIADEIGFAVHNVYRHMQKVGIEIEGKQIPRPPRGVAMKHDEIVIAAKECRTYSDIAKRVGFSPPAVTKYMKLKGIEIEGHVGRVPRVDKKKNKEIIQQNCELESEPTLKNWYAYWYTTYRKANVQDVTRTRYEGIFGTICNHEISDKKIKDITRGDAQNYMNWYGRDRSKNTVYDHWQLVRSAFSDAVADGYIKLNPFKNLRPIFREQNMSVSELKEKRDEKKWLEMDEYMKLKYHLLFWMDTNLKEPPIYASSKSKAGKPVNSGIVAKQMVRAVIFIALKTGARIAEVLGLTREDILFETDEINIEKTWDYRKGDRFKKTKNLASIRKVYTDKETMQTMQKYFDWMDKYNVETKEGTLFITDGIGTHMSTFNLELNRILEELAIEKITMHKLRHTQASILIAKDVPLQLVAKRLGHTDTMMIQRVYGHLLKETEERGNKMIAGFL